MSSNGLYLDGPTGMTGGIGGGSARYESFYGKKKTIKKKELIL